MIGLEPQLLIGLYRVQPLVLKFVGLELGHQSYPTTLLQFIKKHACPGLRDHRERHLQLLATVAAQRAENVAGQALRVNPHQRRRCTNVAEDERDRFFLAPVTVSRSLLCRAVACGSRPELAFEAHNAEMSPTSREIGLSQLVQSELGAHRNIIDGDKPSVCGGLLGRCVRTQEFGLFPAARRGVNRVVAPSWKSGPLRPVEVVFRGLGPRVLPFPSCRPLWTQLLKLKPCKSASFVP